MVESEFQSLESFVLSRTLSGQDALQRIPSAHDSLNRSHELCRVRMLQSEFQSLAIALNGSHELCRVRVGFKVLPTHSRLFES